MAPAINLIVVCLTIVLSPIIRASDLTRASGLVHYPNHRPDANYQLDPYLQQQQQGAYPAQNLAKIRILLERNISNLNHDRLTEPLTSYFGALGVGSPTKMFNVLFDTSTSQVWLPKYISPFLFWANNLHYSEGHSCRDSSTCRAHDQKITIPYRNTDLTGEIYDDKFTFYQDMRKDGAMTLVAPQLSFSQNFLGVGEASDEQFRYKPYDGVIGLAPVVNSGAGVGNILLSLQQELMRQHGEFRSSPPEDQYGPNSVYQQREVGYNQHLPNSCLVFAFWFNPDQNSPFGGELTLGGIDENRFRGDIFYHKLTSWTGWQLKLNYVMLGNNVVSCPNGCQVRLDSGANSFVGPREDVDHIRNELQARYEQAANIWLVDCDRLDYYPHLTFMIDNTPYSLSPLHYIKLFKFQDGLVCYLTIKSWEDRGNYQDWLLGTNFLGAYYSVFDFVGRRVGFATAT